MQQPLSNEQFIPTNELPVAIIEITGQENIESKERSSILPGFYYSILLDENGHTLPANGEANLVGPYESKDHALAAVSEFITDALTDYTKENNDMISVDLKLLDDGVKIPEYATDESMGVDLRANISASVAITPNQTLKIGTGIAFQIKQIETEDGSVYQRYGALIFPRSGSATKKGLVLANTVGVIDPDYQGEIILSIKNTSAITQFLEVQERIAQMVFIPFEKAAFDIVNEFATKTDRGEGGFGSTGTK
jgi:dUTP pyrophosphatase